MTQEIIVINVLVRNPKGIAAKGDATFYEIGNRSDSNFQYGLLL